MEADPDGTIVESEIQIGHKQFQTIGVLIHELAHMYSPHDEHGEEFQKAYKWLKIFWKNTMVQLGGLDGQKRVREEGNGLCIVPGSSPNSF